jgi:carbonic anhydrase
MMGGVSAVVEYAVSAAESLSDKNENANERLKRLTQENVLLQLQHLRTHPSVAGALARGDLTISGWVYNIGTGEVLISENGDRAFHRATVAGTAA